MAGAGRRGTGMFTVRACPWREKVALVALNSVNT